MWISSYCLACIYHTTVRLLSLLTYEDGNSPAMKHIKHISGVKKLVEAIHIIQNKQQCQTTEYDIQFICCSCEISEIERKNMVRKHRKKHLYDSKRFKRGIQQWIQQKKKELSRKRRQNYRSLDGIEKKITSQT